MIWGVSSRAYSMWLKVDTVNLELSCILIEYSMYLTGHTILIRIHMRKTYTESITKSIFNKETGEIHNEIYLRDTSSKKNIKQGWRMYYIDYDEMLEKVVRSNRDIMSINHIKSLIKKDFTLHLNITKESKKMGIGRDKLSKLISRLVDADFLRREETGFVSNPFMYIPYMAQDPLKMQEKWLETKENQTTL